MVAIVKPNTVKIVLLITDFIDLERLCQNDKYYAKK